LPGGEHTNASKLAKAYLPITRHPRIDDMKILHEAGGVIAFFVVTPSVSGKKKNIRETPADSVRQGPEASPHVQQIFNDASQQRPSGNTTKRAVLIYTRIGAFFPSCQVANVGHAHRLHHAVATPCIAITKSNTPMLWPAGMQTDEMA
jgi:hypothetical protein